MMLRAGECFSSTFLSRCKRRDVFSLIQMRCVFLVHHCIFLADGSSPGRQDSQTYCAPGVNTMPSNSQNDSVVLIKGLRDSEIEFAADFIMCTAQSLIPQREQHSASRHY
jgi:hypothetical protein